MSGQQLQQPGALQRAWAGGLRGNSGWRRPGPRARRPAAESGAAFRCSPRGGSGRRHLEPVGEAKFFEGRLAGFADGKVRMELKGKEARTVEVPLEAIRKANLVVEF